MGQEPDMSELMQSFPLVALGANVSSQVGMPALTLHTALGALVTAGFTIRKVSRFFRTPCFPAGAGPDYINAAVELQGAAEWAHDPKAILTRLHAVEADFGRLRQQRWGARTLDLDLISLGAEVLPSVEEFEHWRRLDPALQAQAAPDRLILPHPRIQDRGFVLVPLVDIAPEWRHPVFGRTAAEMLGDLAPADRADIVAI